MKLARQHLRIIKRFADWETFQPLTRFQMTRHQQDEKLGKRHWNTLKSRRMCIDPWHYDFLRHEGDICPECGREKGFKS